MKRNLALGLIAAAVMTVGVGQAQARTILPTPFDVCANVGGVQPVEAVADGLWAFKVGTVRRWDCVRLELSGISR